MLRTLFVLAIAAFGSYHAVRGPFYALLLYLWLAYFRPEYWVWGGIAASLNLSFIVGAFLVLSSAFRGPGFRLDTRAFLLFALLAQSLLSTVLSENFDYCWPYFRDFAKSTIISYLISCLVTDRHKFRLTFLVIAASLGFEVAKQGWLQLVLNPGEKNYNPHPFLGDENGVALGVLMLVPILTALAQTSDSKWHRRAIAFVTVGAIYRAISTYSRGAFLSTGALGAMLFLRSKHKLRTVVGFAVVCAIVMPVLPDAFWERMGSVSFSEERLAEEDDSSRGRLHFWRVAVLMANDRPLTGVGHNGFNPSYNAYDFLSGRYGSNRAVHSTWFGTLAELGYPGAALFAMNILFALLSCWQVRRAVAAGPPDKELVAYAVALESSVVVFMVGGTFLSSQYVEMLWHIIGLSAALLVISREPAKVPGGELQSDHARTSHIPRVRTPAPALRPVAGFRGSKAAFTR